MVDEHQSLRSRSALSPSRPQNIPLYGCQSLRLGAHLEPMSLSFHSRWSEDQPQLHIKMLEVIAIRFALIRALKYIHHSSVMISTDNTTVVSYINKHGGTHSPNLCVEVWKNPPVVSKTAYCRQDSTNPRQIQCFGRQVIENRQNNQRMGIGSIDSEFNFPTVQLSQYGSVCHTFQSQTSTLSIPSSGQSSLSDRRILYELEQSSCLCISSNNTDFSCLEQDTSVSVQNSSYSPSLAATSMVLRGTTTACISSSSSSIFFFQNC